MAASPRRHGLGRTGLIVLGVCLAGLIAFVASTRSGGDDVAASEAGTLRHIPAGPLLVAEIDVTALRKTPVGAQLLGEGRAIAGLGEIQKLCGSDPLDGVQRMALSVPELAGVGFGLFATGDIDREALLGCAAKILEQRGGKPQRQRQGAFEVLADASQTPEGARLAVADGGPLLLTEPAYLTPSLAVSPDTSAAGGPHEKLQGLVPPGVMVITAVLSETQRATLLDELRVQGATASPLRGLRDAAVSLRIVASAAAEGAPAGDGQVSVSAVLRCDAPEAAKALADDFEARRRKASSSIALRLVGLGGLLDAIRLRSEDRRVHADVTLPSSEVARLLSRLAALGRRRGGIYPAPAPPPARTSAPPRAPPAATATGLSDDAGVKLKAVPSATSPR